MNAVGIDPSFYFYILIPLVASFFTTIVRIIGRNDAFTGIRKEEFSIGLELGLTAIIILIADCAHQSRPVVTMNDEPAMNLQSAPSTVLLFVLALSAAAIIVRKFGWRDGQTLHTVWGFLLPSAVGLGAMVLVLTWLNPATSSSDSFWATVWIGSVVLSTCGFGALAGVVVGRFILRQKRLPTFMTYSQRDLEAATRITRELNNNLCRVTRMDAVPRTGESPCQAVQAMLEQTDLYIPIFSENTMTSDWLDSQVRIALEKNKLVMPILLEGGKLPDQIKGVEVVELKRVDSAHWGRLIKKAINRVRGMPLMRA